MHMMFNMMTKAMMSQSASASFTGAASAVRFILVILGAILVASIIISVSLLGLAGLILLVLPVLVLALGIRLSLSQAPIRRVSHA